MKDLPLIDPTFQAVPLQTITAPSLEPQRISCPPLPKRGCREYLRRIRKMIELELSSLRDKNRSNRASRRGYARTVRFA